MTPMIMKSDVLVYGSTPCGIAAAITAAQYGRTVSLVTPSNHVGGLMSSGLSITDLRFKHAFGGIFNQFKERVLDYYINLYGVESEQVQLCNEGIWFEPHVAELIFDRMLEEHPQITLYKNRNLLQVTKDGLVLKQVEVFNPDLEESEYYDAQVFIDSTYEGDLAARAGVPFRVGRESREQYKEPYAGFIFLKNPGLQVLEGSTGEGDDRIQAYNYRLCLTNRDDLRILPSKPEYYSREDYAPLVQLCQDGKLKSLNDVIRLAPIPNGKFNGNNRPIVRSLDLPEVNTGYPNGDESTRKKIKDVYKNYMLGLLWFVQNDAELSEELRLEARTWGFCKDEFADNAHIPYELYVREARRIVGRKTFTSHDAFLAPGSERAPIHEDSVAVGDYHVDSHLVQRQQVGWPQIEGHVYLRALSKPAQIPFGIMVPEEIQGLLVPGALSATHLGFSVLRMEPPWMALGQAAGTAAHLAIERNENPSEIPVSLLQRKLIEAGQVITFFFDVSGPDPTWLLLNKPFELTKQDVQIETAPKKGEPIGLQYFGAKGFFNSYYARPYDPVTRTEAVRWLYDFMKLEGHDFGMDNQKEASETSYTDIDFTYPDYDKLMALSKLKIIERWINSDGFYPAAAVSRADAVRWVVKTKLITDTWEWIESSSTYWSDLHCTHPDAAFFHLLLDHNGLPISWRNPETEIHPQTYITREEFCELLYRALVDR